MSNTAMKPARFRSAFSLFASALLALAGCTREAAEPDLPLGRPVLESAAGAPLGPVIRIELSARFPGVDAWNARLEREASGAWRMTSRSDAPSEAGDLADSALVEHFLETLSTFATESPAAAGNDASFGLNPFRLEIRVSDGVSARVLRLGDPVSSNGVAFRIGERTAKTWVGRGALIAMLPTVERPDALLSKSPYFAPIDAFRSVRIEKLRAPNRGVWEFEREGDRWRAGKTALDDAKNAVLERIFRQRLLRVLSPSDHPDLDSADWKITVRTSSGEETLTIVFVLNDVDARNPTRSDRALALYPEFAGALRAFTQARFTPRRSGTK